MHYELLTAHLHVFPIFEPKDPLELQIPERHNKHSMGRKKTCLDEGVFDFLEKLGSLIAEMFGNKCEVVISDLDNPDSAIISIFNGHVTGRKIGDPLPPQALERVQYSADGYYINYHDSKNGKYLKTSTISARIGGRNIAFCINYDCKELSEVQYILNEFLQMQDEQNGKQVESIAGDLNLAIQNAIVQVGKQVRLMNKKDRIKVIESLNKIGVFQVQRSIQAVALRLGISRYTVYNYLNELKECEKK